MLILVGSAIAGFMLALAPGPTMLGLGVLGIVFRERMTDAVWRCVSFLRYSSREPIEPDGRWRPGFNFCRLFVLAISAGAVGLGLLSVAT
jgi:hypothetical protein